MADSTSSSQPLTAATGHSDSIRTICANWGYVRPEVEGRRQRRPAENVAYALRTRVPDMSPNCHQLPTIATISYLRT